MKVCINNRNVKYNRKIRILASFGNFYEAILTDNNTTIQPPPPPLHHHQNKNFDPPPSKYFSKIFTPPHPSYRGIHAMFYLEPY